MLEMAGLFYGMLLTFVLSAASRNQREGRSHSPALLYAGYVLCGLSAGLALLLPAWGLMHLSS